MTNASNVTIHPVPAPSVDVPAVVGIGAVTLSVIGWLGGWAFKHIVNNWEKSFERLERRIDGVEASHTVSCETFVRRDDYLRGMVGLDSKLDAIAKRQDEQFRMMLDRLDKGN